MLAAGEPPRLRGGVCQRRHSRPPAASSLLTSCCCHPLPQPWPDVATPCGTRSSWHCRSSTTPASSPCPRAWRPTYRLVDHLPIILGTHGAVGFPVNGHHGRRRRPARGACTPLTPDDLPGPHSRLDHRHRHPRVEQPASPTAPAHRAGRSYPRSSTARQRLPRGCPRSRPSTCTRPGSFRTPQPVGGGSPDGRRHQGDNLRGPAAGDSRRGPGRFRTSRLITLDRAPERGGGPSSAPASSDWPRSRCRDDQPVLDRSSSRSSSARDRGSVHGHTPSRAGRGQYVIVALMFVGRVGNDDGAAP